MHCRNICHPCRRLGYLSEATKHCTECRENSCRDCLLDHKKYKFLIGHHIVDIAIASNRYFDSTSFCPDHKDFSQDFFCPGHEQLCCKSCIADTHKTCDNIKPLEIVSSSVKQSSMYDDFQKEITDLHESVEKFKKYRTKWATSKDAAREHLKTAKAKISKHIDDLEEKLLLKIESRNPVSDFDEAIPIEDDVKEICNKFEFISKHGSENQIFLLMLKLRSSISSNFQKIKDTASTRSSSELVFEETDIVSLFESIGNIDVRTEPCDTLSCSQKLKQAQERIEPQETKS